MNSYYHEFSIGWNWWYIVLPILLVVSYMLGRHQAYRRGTKIRVRKTLTIFDVLANIFAGTTIEPWLRNAAKSYRKEKINFFSIVCGAVCGVMLLRESYDGVVQVFDNNAATGDSGVYSLLMAFLVIFGCSIFYGFAVYAVQVYGRKSKLYDLRAERRAMQEEHPAR